MKQKFTTHTLIYLKTLLLLFIVNNLNAQNTNENSLLEYKFPEKPFIVVNIKSNDCMTCWGLSTNLIDKIKTKDKLIILFDDQTMSLYVEKNKNKFEGLNIIYDNDLSKKFSIESKSSVSVVTKKNTNNIYLSNINDSIVDSINNILQNIEIDNKISNIEKYKGVKFDNSNFIYDRNSSILFNNKYQIGFYSTNDNIVYDYIEPKYSNKTTNLLNRFIKLKNETSYVSDSVRELILNKVGMPNINIKNLEFNEKIAIGLKLNTVINKSDPLDTNLNFSVISKYFIAINTSQILNTLNVDSYSHYYLIDTFYHIDKYLAPISTFGFQLIKNKLFIPFMDYVSGTDKEKHYLVEFTIDSLKNNKLEKTNIFPLTDFDNKSTEDILLRVDENYTPFVIYKNQRLIYNCKTEKSISINKLNNFDQNDSTIFIYDFKVKNNEINILFHKGFDTLYKSIYLTKTQKKVLKNYKLEPNTKGAKFNDYNNKISLYITKEKIPFYNFKLINFNNEFEIQR
jgi:hypothetical protein